MQPESIRKFTLFYLGSLAVSLVATLVSYDQVVDSVVRQSTAAGVELGSGLVVGSIIVGAAITVLLWYLAARKRLVIAKWIIVGFLLFSLFGSFGVFAGGISASEALGLVSLALQAVAVFYLFQPDAKAWFAAKPNAEDEVTPEG